MKIQPSKTPHQTKTIIKPYKNIKPKETEAANGDGIEKPHKKHIRLPISKRKRNMNTLHGREIENEKRKNEIPFWLRNARPRENKKRELTEMEGWRDPQPAMNEINSKIR